MGSISSVPCNDLTSFVGTQKWKHVRIAKSGSQECNLLKFPDCMAINWIKIWMNPCKALAASLHAVNNYLWSTITSVTVTDAQMNRCTDAQMHKCTDAMLSPNKAVLTFADIVIVSVKTFPCGHQSMCTHC